MSDSRRLPKNTSSATYAALAEPGRSNNGKLIAVCVVLGVASAGLYAAKDSLPDYLAPKKKPPQVATAPEAAHAKAAPIAAPAPAPAPVKPAPTAPKPKPKVTPKVEPRRETAEPPRRKLGEAPPPERQDPSEPAEYVPGPAPQVPGPAPQTPDEPTGPPPTPPREAGGGPSDAPGSVSEGPAVGDVGSPLDPEKPSAKAENLKPNEKVERFPDGSIKLRFTVDSKGLKAGSYLENHPNGKPAVKATYKNDKLDGVLTEADAHGKVLKKATYKAGLLHGDFATADATGKITAKETWFEGKLIYPKTLEQIERKLAEIASEPLAGPAGAAKLPEFEPYPANGQIRALRRLRAYRYLCDVPYDVTLSRPYGELATAASRLLEIIGHLDHTPEKPPGVPDSLYVPARQGLEEGNLHEHSERRGDTLIVGGVDIWIFDSDRRNIKEVGHRRWSLNPRMKEVAWGARDKFTVMYAHDSQRTGAKARDFVAYPSRGYFPISYLVPGAAWSCAVDQDRYRMSEDAKVEVCPADEKLRKGEPLELHDVAVNKVGFGDSEAIIFKPEATVSAGARYWVTVKGVTDHEGKPVTVEYLVEFCRG